MTRTKTGWCWWIDVMSLAKEQPAFICESQNSTCTHCTAMCSMRQVQGSSRDGATRMWQCWNVCWSSQRTDWKWTRSPGITPHHSDINGQPGHSTRLTQSGSWICHTGHHSWVATPWRQWETVSITTGQLQWPWKQHAFQPQEHSFSLNQTPCSVSLVLIHQWVYMKVNE